MWAWTHSPSNPIGVGRGRLLVNFKFERERVHAQLVFEPEHKSKNKNISVKNNILEIFDWLHVDKFYWPSKQFMKET